jgi:hypothetical protein
VEQTGTPCWSSESLNRANRPKQTHNDLKALGKKKTLSPWIFAGERIISSEMPDQIQGVPYIGYTQGILLRKNLRRRSSLFYKPGRSLRLLLGPASWMP